MASYTGGGSNGPDYVQPGEPANPDPLETWYDTDADPDGDGTAQGQYKIYGTDGNWHSTSVESHRALRDVLEDSHHTYPVPTAGLAADSVTTAKVAADAVTNALIAADAVDSAQIAADAVTTALIANGAVDTAQIATGAVRANELAFDPATQTELNSHAGDADAHHAKPTQTQSAGTVHTGSATVGAGANFNPPVPILATSVSWNYDITLFDNSTGQEVTIEPSGTIPDWPIYWIQSVYNPDSVSHDLTWELELPISHSHQL